MATLLQRQAAAFRQEHAIPEGLSQRKRQPAPSVLFSPEEAKSHDAEDVAVIARQGLAALAALDPDAAAFTSLFDGPPQDRGLLTSAENERLNERIRRLLLLMSPHLMTRGAQECLEGLLHHYHVHRWNVDDVLACALPYHDSPFFTRLLQGLHVAGKPRWAWLKPLKEKPTTLVRGALAKYCAKDLAVLSFLGDVLQETAAAQKTNTVLTTFFCAVWLDALAIAEAPGPDLVLTALPPVLAALRRPHLRDTFHAAVTVGGALCVKVELESSVKTQLLERVAKHCVGALGTAALAFLVIVLQLQQSDGLPDKAARSLIAVGADALLQALPRDLDCGNFLALLVEASVLRSTSASEASDGNESQLFLEGLFSDASVVDCYATPISLALFQAFQKACIDRAVNDAEQQRVAAAIQKPLAIVGARQPLALSAALTKAAKAATERGVKPELLTKISAPLVGCVTEGVDDSEDAIVDVISAFSEKSVKKRCKAVRRAVSDLQQNADDTESARQRVLVSLLLQAAQDQELEVAKTALHMDVFWSSLPQADAATTVFFLMSSVENLMTADSEMSGEGVGALLSVTFFESQRVRTLFPLLLQCFSLVYCRADCDEMLRRSVDIALLPLIVLCAVGLDFLVAAKSAENCADLSAAVVAFCKVSEHSLLAHFKAEHKSDSTTAHMCKKIANAMDMSGLRGLCNLAEGRPWETMDSEEVLQGQAPRRRGIILGGRAAQIASVVLLCEVLPNVFESLSENVNDLEQAVVRCASACECFARHVSYMRSFSAHGSEHVCKLAEVIVSRLNSTDAKRRDAGKTASPGKVRIRRKSSGSSGGGPAVGSRPLQQAVMKILCIALECPRKRRAVLQSVLALAPQLVQPALLKLALSSELRSGSSVRARTSTAVTTNALLLLHSLLASKTAQQWHLDQCLVIAFVAKLESSESLETRQVIVSLLEMLRSVDWEQLSAPSWESSCAVCLREAEVFQEHHQLLSSSGWAAVGTDEFMLAGLSHKSFQEMLDHIIANKTGILQDRSAVITVLSQFLAKSVKTTRIKECVFWAGGLSLLTQPPGVQVSPLMGAVPLHGFLSGLKEPLRKSLDELIANLANGSVVPDVPILLKTAALKVAENTSGGRLRESLSEKARTVSAKVIGEFMENLVQPLCGGLCGFYKKSSGRLPEPIVGLVCAIIGCVPDALRAYVLVSGKMPSGVVEETLKLCIASAPSHGQEQEETPSAMAPSIFSTVHSAFVSMPIGAELLRETLQTLSAKLKKLDSNGQRVAFEAVYQHIAGFRQAESGADGLLLELAAFASDQAKAASSSDDGPLSFSMLAIAALSEHLGSFHDAETDHSACVATVCSHLNGISGSLGTKLPSEALSSIIRSCNALAPLTKFSAKDIPPTVNSCVEALANFQSQLSVELLGLLKVSLWQFWKYPKGDQGDDDASIAKREGRSQHRTRLLLQAFVVRCRGLLNDVTPNICVSFAQSVGVGALLDFAVILILVRHVPPDQARKPAVKRRASERIEDASEEAMQAAEKKNDAQEAESNADEAAIDAATLVFTSNSQLHRFHGLGTLAQTMACLTLELSRPGCKKYNLFWGVSLLPESFVQDVGRERCFWLLAMSLATMHRLIEEHGLPEGLDDVRIDASRSRSMSSLASKDTVEAEKTASGLSLCYVTKTTCVIEALLDQINASDKERSHLAACKERARQLRQLLLRSLAVNHPCTFFHAICFGLHIVDLSPAVVRKDVLAGQELVSVELGHLLTSACDALSKYHDFISPEADAEELSESKSLCAPLCTAALQNVCERLVQDETSEGSLPASMQIIIWRFLEGLCQFFARTSPQPVLRFCLPAAAKCLQAVRVSEGIGIQEGVACCQCLLTAVEELGKAVLPGLRKLLPPLLDLIDSFVTSSAKQEATPLEGHVFQVLQALMKKVGPFMSPYLERVLVVLIAPAPVHRLPYLQDLGQVSAASVPQRLLLPAVQTAVTVAASRLAEDATLENSLINMQRLAVMLVWIFSASSPEFVSSGAEAAIGSIVKVFAAGSTAGGRFLSMGGVPEELPTKILRRDLQRKTPLLVDVENIGWADWCADSSVLRMTALAAAAFTQLALRLSIDDLKPRFVKVLDWARNMQTQALAQQSTRKNSASVDISVDTDAACRVLSLCSLMHGLASEAPDISEELFLPLVLKDLVSSLNAARRQALRLASEHRSAAKRRRREASGNAMVATVRPSEVLHQHTWWWFEVMVAVLDFVTQALKHAGGVASQTKVVDETVEALVEPVSEALAVCEFLPSFEGSDLTRCLLEAIQRALVVLSAASDGQRIKRLLSAVLSKTRSEDPELRLCAVKACHRIWADIGVQAVSGLSEVLMYAVELLEDEDPRVETAVRSLVKTMETCTGESLQEHLKH